MSDEQIIRETKQWIRNFVIGLNLCPFASQPFLENKIDYFVNRESEIIPILNSVLEICNLLVAQSDVETAFLILSELDIDFPSFHHMTEDLQTICSQKNIPIRLISFHPKFHYQSTSVDDTGNATNRSPFPMIHFLRKSSLAKASNSTIDIEQLLTRNKQTLTNMTWEEIQRKILNPKSTFPEL